MVNQVPNKTSANRTSNPENKSNSSGKSGISLNEKILLMTNAELKELCIVSDLDNESYHKAYGLSCTNFNIMLRSPAYYQASLLFPRKTTAEMQLGPAPHAAVVQPKLFEEQYMKLPKLDRRTKEGKELYKRYSESGKILLDSVTVSTLQKMKESLMQHPIISSVLSDGWPGLSLSLAECAVSGSFLTRQREAYPGIPLYSCCEGISICCGTVLA